jgi:hypothetical protein
VDDAASAFFAMNQSLRCFRKVDRRMRCPGISRENQGPAKRPKIVVILLGWPMVRLASSSRWPLAKCSCKC